LIKRPFPSPNIERHRRRYRQNRSLLKSLKQCTFYRDMHHVAAIVSEPALKGNEAASAAAVNVRTARRSSDKNLDTVRQLTGETHQGLSTVQIDSTSSLRLHGHFTH
jgi:hypothetical protein